MELATEKHFSKGNRSMTNMRDGHVTVTEIWEERILYPTVGDVTLSAQDVGQRAAERPWDTCKYYWNVEVAAPKYNKHQKI